MSTKDRIQDLAHSRQVLFLETGSCYLAIQTLCSPGWPRTPNLCFSSAQLAAIMPGSPYSLWTHECSSEKGSKAPSISSDSSKLDERDSEIHFGGCWGQRWCLWEEAWDRSPSFVLLMMVPGIYLGSQGWSSTAGHESVHRERDGLSLLGPPCFGCLGQPNEGMMEAETSLQMSTLNMMGT